MLNNKVFKKHNLTKDEVDFIMTIASDFINSYTVNGQVSVEQEDNPEEVFSEINICQDLIIKFLNWRNENVSCIFLD